MKKIITIILILFSLGVFAQPDRDYTKDEIFAIHDGREAFEGDFYYDKDDDILYIGLKDGRLVPIIDTDNQSVDEFSINGSNQLILSLERDEVAPTLVDLSPYVNTDDQQLDVSTFTSSGLNLSLENDGVATIEIPLISTDAANDIVFSGDGLFLNDSDDQTLTYTNTDPDDNQNTLQIEGSPVLSIDDNHIATDDQTLDGDRLIDLNAHNLTFQAGSDIIIQSDGDVGIGTLTPAARLDVDNGSVRFSDYGVGDFLDSSAGIDDAVYHMAVDAQGDFVETNTVKSSKVFYPPAIPIDVSTVVSGEEIDLYDEYISRMGSPMISSTTNAIPTYSRNELEYHILDYDTSVFRVNSLSATGVVNYDVISTPRGSCTYINVVMVVK